MTISTLADLEAHDIMRAYRGYWTTSDDVNGDGDFILALAERIRRQRGQRFWTLIEDQSAWMSA